MPKAIVVKRHGGPEVLEWIDVDVPAPGPGEVLVRHTAVGLNYIDVYQRTGLYPLDLPFTPGGEAAGVVQEVGQGVTDLIPGDRVAYTGNGPAGSYCEQRVLPRERLVKLPDAIDDVTAAAIMLKGCTVEYLVRRTFPVRSTHIVLWHAAAGGVGLIACQWLRALGATVIGTTGSEEKADIAREHGCNHVILYREENVADRVRELTDGRGVDVVYDAVGKSTFDASLDSLRRRGTMVSFGNASGPVAPFSPLLLSQKGSLFLTRPTLRHYYSDPEECSDGFAALFEMVQSQKVKAPVYARYALKDATEAHRALGSRRTTGATVLLV
jgi:NADPH:quinone reductase